MGSPIKNRDTYPSAVITGLFRGTDADSFMTENSDELVLSLEGIVGEPREKRHGFTMPADVRTRGVRKGTLVPHQQHVSIIDEDSIRYIGDELDIEGTVTEKHFGLYREEFIARCIGVNILVSDFSNGRLHEVPNGSVMGKVDEAGYFETGVQISRYNSPCISPGKALRGAYPNASKSMASEFVKVAEKRRGLVAGVYVAGKFAVSDEVLFVPKQSTSEG